MAGAALICSNSDVGSAIFLSDAGLVRFLCGRFALDCLLLFTVFAHSWTVWSYRGSQCRSSVKYRISLGILHLHSMFILFIYIILEHIH